MNDDKNIPSRPKSLARLLDLDVTQAGLWNRDEFRDILKHQLSASILYDTNQLHAGLGERARAIIPSEDLTFGEALLNSGSSGELLELIKDFAKLHRQNERSGIPMEIATILYYTAIAAAFCNHSARITRLSDPSLRGGWSWIIEQEWIPDAIKEVSKAAILCLDRGCAG